MIEALTAQIAALTGGSTTTTTSGYSFSRDLTLGSTGADVMALQKFLNNKGFTVSAAGAGSPGQESTYFGGLTTAALARYQASQNIAPAVGYFGPITRANVNAMNTTTTTVGGGGSGDTGDTGSTGLEGGAGDITIDGSSQYSGEEVGEGEDDVEVLAFDVEADDNSDVSITSIKVELYQQTATDSRDLDDYATEVSVWFDGEKVGSDDADDFNESSDIWSKSIALDDVVIKAGEEERIIVAVSALNNIDSADHDSDDWHVGVSSVRFEDGDGAIITESVTLDIDDDAVNDEVERAFHFADFGTANDADLSVSLGDDDINDARVLEADDNSDTEHEILSFLLEADGDSDIWVDEIPVVITTTGETDESVLIIKAT
ncbi:MAG: peptidoglycan-binding domain-containing protein, partial [Candidatus Paceibacterota bacterium]